MQETLTNIMQCIFVTVRTGIQEQGDEDNINSRLYKR